MYFGLYLATIQEKCDFTGIYFREWLNISRNHENFYPRKCVPLKYVTSSFHGDRNMDESFDNDSKCYDCDSKPQYKSTKCGDL